MGWGCRSGPPISGLDLPLDRYQAPRNPSQSIGFVARGLLPSVGTGFPRGESPRPQTKSFGSTAFKASYAAARNVPHRAAETFLPRMYCGFANRLLLHSFMTTNSRTCGYATARPATHRAKRPTLIGLASAAEWRGYTSKVTLTPAAPAPSRA